MFISIINNEPMIKKINFLIIIIKIIKKYIFIKLIILIFIIKIKYIN